MTESVTHTMTETMTDSADQVRTLLYVEDHPASVSVMQAVLELRPVWRFVHAGTIAAGLEVARTQRPDLILLDMHLPDGSGADALVTLKADPQTQSVPVVILTAGNTGTADAALLAAGADQLWTKPHDLGLMLDYFDEVAART